MKKGFVKFQRGGKTYVMTEEDAENFKLGWDGEAKRKRQYKRARRNRWIGLACLALGTAMLRAIDGRDG